MNETYLYPYSAKEARERNELSLWRESHRANIACREAIEDAIRRSFDGMHLDKDCITPVLDEKHLPDWAREKLMELTAPRQEEPAAGEMKLE